MRPPHTPQSVDSQDDEHWFFNQTQTSNKQLWLEDLEEESHKKKKMEGDIFQALQNANTPHLKEDSYIMHLESFVHH